MTRQTPFTKPLFAKPLIIALVLLFTAIMGVSLAWKIFYHLWKGDQTDIYQQRIEQLEKEVDELEMRLDEQQQPYFQEKVIRDQLNMQKEGEIILQLPDSEPEE